MSNDNLKVVKLEIEKLQLKPGDILCFRFPRGYSDEDAEYFRYSLVDARIIPNGVGVMLLTDGVELTVIEKE